METVVISLGGSVLAPANIDTNFLRKFRDLIVKSSKKKRFVIICGGGKTARDYMAAADKVTRLTPLDLDWLGIHATRLNAQLLRNVFRGHAHQFVIKNPAKKIMAKEHVIIAAGWKPGRSTDHVAVMLAKNLRAKTVINITSTSYVYDKDPRKFKNAKPISCICWMHFRKLLGTTRWNPGLNSPFDPIAAKEADRLKLRVAIIGKDLKNLAKFLSGKGFRGTLIE